MTVWLSIWSYRKAFLDFQFLGLKPSHQTHDLSIVKTTLTNDSMTFIKAG